MNGCCGAGTSGETVGAKVASADIHEVVRERYAGSALAAASGRAATCGGCGCGDPDPVTGNLYAADELAAVPEGAVLASLGCGNPTALAELRPGEVVLDLGSGGGIDVLLSARRVGPTGKAYGLDMTDEMLALARRNQAEAGVLNAEFLRGRIEEIPLPEKSVDVIISNCVVNLSPDKDRVLREAFRVLRPGGRLAISDVVVQGELAEELRRSMELWTGCLAGALGDQEYVRKLGAAGFVEVEIEITREYDPEVVAAVDPGVAAAAATGSGGRLGAAFIRARRPPLH